jgi:hypothetical protein
MENGPWMTMDDLPAEHGDFMRFRNLSLPYTKGKKSRIHGIHCHPFE